VAGRGFFGRLERISDRAYALVGLLLLLATRANILALGDDVAQGLGCASTDSDDERSCGGAGEQRGRRRQVDRVRGLLVPYCVNWWGPTTAFDPASRGRGADGGVRHGCRVTFRRIFGAAHEYPVGIITAVIGGPLFLWLVRARRAQW
jgi:hypothetical protein